MIYIIGNGKAANWLYRRLQNCQLVQPDSVLSGRNPHLQNKDIRSAVFFVAVPDRYIESTAKKYCELLGDKNDNWFVHLSGAKTSKELFSISNACGAFHPAFSIPNNPNFDQVTDPVVTLEGDTKVCDWLRKLAASIKCTPIAIDPDSKSLYHAACVIAGSLNGLMYWNLCQTFKDVGFSSEQSKKIVKDLLESSIANIDQFGVENGMTGPVVRKDLQTQQLNIKALEEKNSAFADVYRALSALYKKTKAKIQCA